MRKGNRIMLVNDLEPEKESVRDEGLEDDWNAKWENEWEMVTGLK